MKESRLFQIVYCLLEKGHVTAPELAEKLEVSVRTIYRDIDALSEAGIPIYTDPGRKGGIQLLDGFVLEKAILSETEKRMILEALQSLSAIEAADNSVLKKVSALFQMQTESWFEVDFSGWGDMPRNKEKFELLKKAVMCHREVEILYMGSDGKSSRRKIQPLKLLCKTGAWYVKAWCLQKQDFRLFKINRMQEISLMQETFLPVDYPKENQVSSGNIRNIRLHFSSGMAYRVYDEFDASQIEKQENGDFIVTAEMPEDAWMIGYLLTFGDKVDILEPEYLREILAEQAKKIYDKNKKHK